MYSQVTGIKTWTSLGGHFFTDHSAEEYDLNSYHHLVLGVTGIIPVWVKLGLKKKD